MGRVDRQVWARPHGTLDALAGTLLFWDGRRPELLPGVFFNSAPVQSRRIALVPK